jgi:hypothetical protein
MSELDRSFESDDEDTRLTSASAQTVIMKSCDSTKPFTVLDFPTLSAVHEPLWIRLLADNVTAKASLSRHRDPTESTKVVRSSEQSHEYWSVMATAGSVTGLHGDVAGSAATLTAHADGHKMIMLMKIVDDDQKTPVQLSAIVDKILDLVNQGKYDQLTGIAQTAVVHLRPGSTM